MRILKRINTKIKWTMQWLLMCKNNYMQEIEVNVNNKAIINLTFLKYKAKKRRWILSKLLTNKNNHMV